MELPLPVVGGPGALTFEAAVRLIKKANLDLALTVAPSTSLSGATVVAEPGRPGVWDINAAYELRIPERMTAAAVLDEIEAHFRDLQSACWLFIPAALEPEAALDFELRARGLEPYFTAVMVMRRAVAPPVYRDDLQVVPARAVVAQYREFRRVMAANLYGDDVADQIADTQVDMLDDSRLDVLVARLNGRAVGAAGLYAAGETGQVWDLATHPEFRRQGVMSTLIARLLELAARSQFKNLILDCHPDNESAIRLYESIGMVKAGEFIGYRRIAS